MGMESMFTIISIVFIVTGVVSIIAGLNFDNQYRKEYKGANKAEYIKLNKLALISMGGIMLFGTFLGLWLPAFKMNIIFISSVCVVSISIIYSMISRKKFSNKKESE
ncbi:hypothetical protein G9F72_020785 [Clostridium estertheticum]|uniref:hypothetical protein n=1 Tax=Clostridium estertheticum TaxID=238834 RepID=UPI001CD0C204|nr:hypothetical protein [Clostridium estertheticum]MBZ9688760.1 hypothetical protein [Clostridium estertheticum]